MKRLTLIFVLLSLFAMTGKAQQYATYELTEHENKLPDIFCCESSMAMIFGYTGFNWIDPVSTSSDPLFKLYGFHYDGDYVMPVWGPIGIDFNFIGLNAGYGNFLGEFAFQMSWNFGIMPIFCVNVTDDVTIRAFAGIKAHIAFLLDGTDNYPITHIDGADKSIGKGVYLQKAIGADITYGDWGIRISYTVGLNGRLKDSYFESSGISREVTDPRYAMLNIGLIYTMDL